MTSASATIPVGYKQTEIGVIPEDWAVKPIGNFAKVVGGGTPSTQVRKYWNGDIEWFTPTEVGSTKYVSNSNRKLTNSGLQNSSASMLPKGTILLTSRAGIGDLSILEFPACTNQGFQSLVTSNNVDNEFLYYVMLTKRPELERKGSGSTFLEISPSEVKSLLIALPGLKEQYMISEVLSDRDSQIRNLEKLISKKQDIKQGAMQELLTGKTRLPGFSGDFRNTKLKEIVNQFIVPMRDKPKTFSGQIPWCRIEDFDGKYLFDSKSMRYVNEETINRMNLKVYPVNTVLVSCSANLGRCAIVKRELVTNQTFIGLVVNEFKASNEYLFYYMKYIERELNNQSSGTTISYLSREEFEDLEVLIPSSKQEQEAISNILSDMDSEIVANEQRLEKAKAIKQGMMQQLLTGSIRLVDSSTPVEASS